MSVNYFIFGYGSLICKDSRAKSGITGEAIPVRVKGLQRVWNHIIPKHLAFATALGAIFKESAICNGVIVSLPDSELPNFDKREIPAGYIRAELPREFIISLTDVRIPRGVIWVYITNKPENPTEESPIIQSYADVALTGCFEYGESFAREFIATTQGWDNFWINDRNNHRYPRAMKDVPLASIFDALFREIIPEAFANRK